jgi:hypothetical protein
MKSLNWTLLIFGATMWSLFVALAASGRLSSSNLLILAALCLTPAGIGFTIRTPTQLPRWGPRIGGVRQTPVLVFPLASGIDLSRPWVAMLNSRGRGRRRW